MASLPTLPFPPCPALLAPPSWHAPPQFWNEERKGHVKYLGAIRGNRASRRGSGAAGAQQLITIKFEWSNHHKPCSSSNIGVMPEFELALYSLFFFLGEESNPVKSVEGGRRAARGVGWRGLEGVSE